MMIQELGTRREARGARHEVVDADLSLSCFDTLLPTEASSCQSDVVSVFPSRLVPSASCLAQS